MIYCHVSEIAVNREYQNQGIGERLLRAAEDWRRSQGAELASLEYHAAYKRAGEFSIGGVWATAWNPSQR